MFLATKGVHPTKRKTLYTMDVGCVRLFQFLLKESKSKFVISSSWRKHTVSESTNVFTALSWCGFVDAKDYCVGVTPRLASNRGVEIDWWLNNHPTENFVILDDDSFDIHQKDQLVRTEHEVGLTVKDVYKAIKIFDLNLDYIPKPS
jgi:hypothetical protein